MVIYKPKKKTEENQHQLTQLCTIQGIVKLGSVPRYR